MAVKVSTVIGLLSLVLVLAVLIATTEGSRRKGKFTTPGGSHCRWMEKKKHNDTDVSYTLKCRCHSKAGGVMRYRCTYQTSFRGRGRSSLQLSESFLQIIKGNPVITDILVAQVISLFWKPFLGTVTHINYWIVYYLGNQHGCNMNSFTLDEEADVTMEANGETAVSDCKWSTNDLNKLHV